VGNHHFCSKTPSFWNEIVQKDEAQFSL